MTMPQQPPPLNLKYVYEAPDVIRVIDGDTVVLRLPLPVDTQSTLSLRLAGINAPETVGSTRAAGLAAAAALRELLSTPGLIAQTLKKEKYGRYLVHLWVPNLLSPGTWIHVNTALIAQGHATPYDGGSR